ncbi:F-box/LRR-repeat protein At3g59200-like [Ipomoea triloba]|uniref:F-box/LRR-repeat protein At3g59200-like n=1 Tax=Ipomoea triloba TaxID=35885 RepID=UPI00125E0F3F|nr:F-box/LRR-repeat protein At3g59200-like [Ipomoea triloba]
MARGRSRDRISQLPADILDHILGFLPIQDAAKTAVLSSIWRDVWFSLTQLNFDHGFFCYIYKKHRHANKYAKKSAVSLYVINKILLLHKGTIRKFVLSFYKVGVVIVREKHYRKKDTAGIMQELLDLPFASTKTKIIIV